MSIRTFEELISSVGKLSPLPVAVAGGADAEVVAGIKQAHKAGFIGECYITGPEENIRRVVAESGDDESLYHFLSAESDSEMSFKAVRAVREKDARIIIKGSVKSEAYLRALLHSETGIKESPVLSNLSLFQMPSLKSFLAVTDNAIIINPELKEKVAIIKNTLPMWRALGISPVRVAALAAIETVNPKMQSTIDAAALEIMSERGQLPGFIVEGPLGYDAAISAECAKSKKLEKSEVCGKPDMILAPNLEAANFLGKSYKFHGNAIWGGLVFGAAVPAVLNSRSDGQKNRFNSVVIARAIAEGKPLK